jgi:hypothetical protein
LITILILILFFAFVKWRLRDDAGPLRYSLILIGGISILALTSYQKKQRSFINAKNQISEVCAESKLPCGNLDSAIEDCFEKNWISYLDYYLADPSARRMKSPPGFAAWNFLECLNSKSGQEKKIFLPSMIHKLEENI